jgi:hypothetical protein
MAGAHEELLLLGERLQAPMEYAMRGEERVEWDNAIMSSCTDTRPREGQSLAIGACHAFHRTAVVAIAVRGIQPWQEVMS